MRCDSMPERDTQPQKWYPRTIGGAVLKFDDLPPEFHGNVEIQPPFDRRAGDQACFERRG